MMFKLYRYRVPKDFDPDEYLLINEDLKAAGVEPFQHYARNGKKEGRKYRLRDLVPENFDRDVYLRLNPDVSGNKTTPEVHYYQYGRWERRLYKLSSSDNHLQEFDEKWYLEEYPEIAGLGTSPFEHYKKVGRFEGRHARFDGEWYRQEYMKIANLDLVDPRRHYRDIGRAECMHPAFDPFWYGLIYPDVAQSSLDPIEHYNECGRREGRHPAFNRPWYEKEYLSAGRTEGDAFEHFMSVGRSSQHQPAFHHEWYRNEYPDSLLTDLLPYAHYQKYGKAVGYQPGPRPDEIPYLLRINNFPLSYASEYQPRVGIKNKSTDIKAIAFYLPQFHEIPENDRWWGQGFTEWTNTESAAPRFDGHYQPRQPHADIGHYDLADPDALRKQADLARAHGIHGFCFYHYWFSGERLLEKPLGNLINNKDIDLNFMICWANENWTRTWDGSDREVLIQQRYLESDPINFIKDVEVYLTDSRYICVDGNPVLLVYKPHIIPDVGDVFAEWRRYWQSQHGRDL